MNKNVKKHNKLPYDVLALLALTYSLALSKFKFDFQLKLQKKTILSTLSIVLIINIFSSLLASIKFDFSGIGIFLDTCCFQKHFNVL